jgi:hypothetical protein
MLAACCRFLLLLLLMPAALAHHSGAIFDSEHAIVIAGTVKEFQWTFPHCYIQLVVRNEAGVEEEWSVEMAAPPYLYSLGWRPSTLKMGDRISVTLRPLRNGDSGGLVIDVRDADGKTLGEAR